MYQWTPLGLLPQMPKTFWQCITIWPTWIWGGHNFLSPFVDFDNFKFGFASSFKLGGLLIHKIHLYYIWKPMTNPLCNATLGGFLSLSLIVGFVHYFICQQTWGKVGAKCCGKCHLSWMEYGRKINDRWMDERFGWLKIIDEKNLREWCMKNVWMMDDFWMNENQWMDDGWMIIKWMEISRWLMDECWMNELYWHECSFEDGWFSLVCCRTYCNPYSHIPSSYQWLATKHYLYSHIGVR